jgi:hypothetical protein
MVKIETMLKHRRGIKSNELFNRIKIRKMISKIIGENSIIKKAIPVGIFRIPFTVLFSY